MLSKTRCPIGSKKAIFNLLIKGGPAPQKCYARVWPGTQGAERGSLILPMTQCPSPPPLSLEGPQLKVKMLMALLFNKSINAFFSKTQNLGPRCYLTLSALPHHSAWWWSPPHHATHRWPYPHPSASWCPPSQSPWGPPSHYWSRQILPTSSDL